MNVKVIKEQWRGRGAAGPQARAMRRLGETLSHVQGESGTAVHVRRGRIRVRAGGGRGLSARKFCFGYSIKKATVTIKAGDIQIGDADLVEIGDTDVELTADYQYVGVEYSADGGGRIIGPGASKLDFKSDSTTFRLWLHQFRLIEGRARLYRIGHIGNILIPVYYADT